MLDAVVIGGGFYGCQIALYLEKKGYHVKLFEAEDELMQRSSYVNQARVHNGYHYPRNILTAQSSHLNFARFSKDYSECIDRSFKKYYAVARNFSKITSKQFVNFCNKLSLPIKIAPDKVSALFDANLIEDVFEVEEYAFNSVKLKNLLESQFNNTTVAVYTGCRVFQVNKSEEGFIINYKNKEQTTAQTFASLIFNCTYSHINTILPQEALPISLKHEMTELTIVEVPEEIKDKGITVMDGPFFSIMPFPSLNLHSLSHVRYTPKYFWLEGEKHTTRADLLARKPHLETGFSFMIKDAIRYMPCLKEVVYKKSLWEYKTILPQTEGNDGRPILCTEINRENYFVVLGGKIDNIYDLKEEINRRLNFGVTPP